MTQIKLTRGYVAAIDDADAPLVTQHSWCAAVHGEGYIIASRRLPGPRKPYKSQTLGEFLIGKKKGYEIDFIDGNSLNNQRNNLRHVTRSLNWAGRKKRKNCSSQYKGVTWNQSKQLWQAYITYLGHHYHLGRFRDEQEAALAYNRKAMELFGEYARLNVIEVEKVRAA